MTQLITSSNCKNKFSLCPCLEFQFLLLFLAGCNRWTLQNATMEAQDKSQENQNQVPVAKRPYKAKIPTERELRVSEEDDLHGGWAAERPLNEIFEARYIRNLKPFLEKEKKKIIDAAEADAKKLEEDACAKLFNVILKEAVEFNKR